jgi:hypothetical protein
MAKGTTQKDNAETTEDQKNVGASLENLSTSDDAANDNVNDAANNAAETVEAELDMSFDARFERATDALEDALQAQNDINKIVLQRTKDLDALIVERDGAVEKNTTSEIQYFLTRQKRNREEKAQRRRNLFGTSIDPMEIIKQLDPRAPIDKNPVKRKTNPVVPRPLKTTA